MNNGNEQDTKKVSGKENSSLQYSNPKANRKIGNLTEKQKKMCIYGIIIVLIIIVIVMIGSSHVLEKSNLSPQEKAKNYMEKTVKSFYEDYYYDELVKLEENKLIEDVPTFLSNFETEGIPISIQIMIENKYIGESEIQENLGKYDCNYDNTATKVYPKSPYGKKDYTLETTLDCKIETE